jgi:hypothetical protein
MSRARWSSSKGKGKIGDPQQERLFGSGMGTSDYDDIPKVWITLMTASYVSFLLHSPPRNRLHDIQKHHSALGLFKTRIKNRTGKPCIDSHKNPNIEGKTSVVDDASAKTFGYTFFPTTSNKVSTPSTYLNTLPSSAGTVPKVAAHRECCHYSIAGRTDPWTSPECQRFILPAKPNIEESISDNDSVEYSNLSFEEKRIVCAENNSSSIKHPDQTFINPKLCKTEDGRIDGQVPMGLKVSSVPSDSRERHRRGPVDLDVTARSDTSNEDLDCIVPADLEVSFVSSDGEVQYHRGPVDLDMTVASENSDKDLECQVPADLKVSFVSSNGEEPYHRGPVDLDMTLSPDTSYEDPSPRTALQSIAVGAVDDCVFPTLMDKSECEIHADSSFLRDFTEVYVGLNSFAPVIQDSSASSTRSYNLYDTARMHTWGAAFVDPSQTQGSHVLCGDFFAPSATPVTRSPWDSLATPRSVTAWNTAVDYSECWATDAKPPIDFRHRTTEVDLLSPFFASPATAPGRHSTVYKPKENGDWNGKYFETTQPASSAIAGLTGLMNEFMETSPKNEEVESTTKAELLTAASAFHESESDDKHLGSRLGLSAESADTAGALDDHLLPRRDNPNVSITEDAKCVKPRPTHLDESVGGRSVLLDQLLGNYDDDDNGLTTQRQCITKELLLKRLPAAKVLDKEIASADDKGRDTHTLMSISNVVSQGSGVPSDVSLREHLVSKVRRRASHSLELSRECEWAVYCIRPLTRVLCVCV